MHISSETNNFLNNIDKKTNDENIPQPWLSIDAEGGEINYIMVGTIQYRVHTFTSSSNFIVHNIGSSGSVQYFMVGGGGAGGRGGYVNPYSWNFGNGGNAGSIKSGSVNVNPQTYSVVVGTGGVGNASGVGGNGTASSFASQIASGGLGKSEYSLFTQSPQNYLQTFRDNTSPGTGASGGKNGIQSNFSGVNTYYAGGGADGGASYQGEVDSVGGLGGGGNGGPGVDSTRLSGSANTGGGGAGFNPNNNPSGLNKGGDGGSGIVMIRYPLQNPNI
jgi:hypothetical protein